MVEFQFIIPLFAFFAWLLGFAKFGSVINPVSIIVAWWSLWLFVSNFSVTGLGIPGAQTQTLVLAMLFSMILGSIFATPMEKNDGSDSVSENQRLYKRWRHLHIAFLFLFPVVAYYFSKAIAIFLSEGVFGYRDAVFGDIDRPSILFESNYIELLYALVLSPMILLSMIAGVTFYLSFRDRVFLSVSLCLIAMDSIMRLGRFNFYYLLFFLFFSYLLLRQRSRIKDSIGDYFRTAVKKVRGTVGALALSMAIILAVVSVVRSENRDNVPDLLIRFAVEYHTVGFVLFDDSLGDPRSVLNREMSYGRSVFGGIDTIVVILLRRIDNTLQSISMGLGPLKREFQLVGYDQNGYPILYNAFYTVLYTLYLDGRELAFFAIPFLFGYFISKRYLDWLRSGDLKSFMLINLLTFVGIFSIFQSHVEGTIFWVSLILIFSLNKIRISRRENPLITIS